MIFLVISLLVELDKWAESRETREAWAGETSADGTRKQSCRNRSPAEEIVHSVRDVTGSSIPTDLACWPWSVQSESGVGTWKGERKSSRYFFQLLKKIEKTLEKRFLSPKVIFTSLLDCLFYHWHVLQIFVHKIYEKKLSLNAPKYLLNSQPTHKQTYNCMCTKVPGNSF